MATKNQVQIEGNLVADGDLKYLQNGSALLKFTVANNRNFKKGEEWVQKTGWYDITCWGQLAEDAVEVLTKGMKVIVDGRLEYETWEGDDGKRHKISITADQVSLPVGSLQSVERKPAKGKADDRPTSADADPF
jgi:single-strand DNA-binding protein